MRRFLSLATVLAALAAGALAQQAPPNFLWIVAEDQSDHYGPFRESLARTPNVDQMAAEGAVFSRTYVTAPVCSPSRSALVTGMYQTTIGAHNHRSGRGSIQIHLQGDVEPIPAILRRAGYYVTNGSLRGGKLLKGKTDYNFEYPSSLYDGADWSGRGEDQPFFAQVQLRGGKFRNQRTLDPVEGVQTRGIPADKVELPPYYPDHPEIRTDWAQYLESIEHVDWEVGQLLQRLEDEGLADNTVVFFLSDHGVSHARGKQFLSEEGTKVPLVVRAPGRVEAGMVREDLVAHIDVAATTLDFAGVELPGWMEGRPLFGPHARPREHVISARDRCDETVDLIRSVRTARYRYVRNSVPERPHLQPNRYKDGKAVIRVLRTLLAEQTLAPDLKTLYFDERPAEELYDLKEDRWELRNLADSEDHREVLDDMRARLDNWIKESGDRGQTLESDAQYDADMEVYLRSKDQEQVRVLKRNLDDVREWRAQRGNGTPVPLQ